VSRFGRGFGEGRDKQDWTATLAVRRLLPNEVGGDKFPAVVVLRLDGAMVIGTVNGVPDGNNLTADTLTNIMLAAGQSGINYNFGLTTQLS